MEIVNVEMLTRMLKAALNGEPVFVLFARDVSTRPTVEFYMKETEARGGKNMYRVNKFLVELKEWQQEHPTRPAD